LIEFIKLKDTNAKIFDDSDNTARFFYQRQGWADFLLSIGQDIEIYVIQREGEIIGNFFIEYHRRKIAKYGYIPAGIHFSNEISLKDETEIYSAFSEFLKSKAKERKVRTIRFDYYGRLDLDNIDYDKSLSAGLPKYSWQIELGKTVEDIRKDMSDSTRHNINKAEKSELIVKKADRVEQVKEFYSLMTETTKRKGFLNFNLNYFISQFESLKGNLCDLYICYYNETPISAAWINYGIDTVFYTHGASTSNRELSKFRSPYLLQWKLITDSKERGFKYYNMWGVLPDYMQNTDNPLKGVSDFKKSFGGEYSISRGIFEVYTSYFSKLITRYYDWWAYRGDRY
jgi:lipid II:glycine glycyltransferase (peptidoglycan interpeptide bridge formation enzyme)